MGFKNYYKATPKNIRKFADALMLAGLYLMTQPQILGEKGTRYTMIAIAIAKLLSNFFSDETLNEKAAKES